MRLSKNQAFYLQASLIVSFLAGSSAPTSLYPLYQEAWRFSPVTVTVVFGIYALAVLGTLLVAGTLSDSIGRRPVLIAGAIAQALTMVVFARASGVGELVAARVLQGLATGATAGAIGAGMLDLDREKGTVANAIAPMVGTAAGGLLSGLFVAYLPAPKVAIYAALGVIFLVQAVGVLAMPESVARRPGVLASLRPVLRVPAHLRPTLWIAVPALVAAWSLYGLYGSLGPALVRQMLGSTSNLLGGLTVFVLAASGATAVFVAHTRSARSLVTMGTFALALGVAITLVAIPTASPVVFFGGAIVAGAGFGLTFQGALRTTLGSAGATERAGVLSTLYVVAYLSMGLPAVLGGLRVVHGNGLIPTAREYGFAVMLLAAIALVGTLVRREAHALATAPRA